MNIKAGFHKDISKKHKDKQVRTLATDKYGQTSAEEHFLTEFSITAPLNIQQDGGQNGWLPCACAYVVPVLTGEKDNVTWYKHKHKKFEHVFSLV